jgi:hypothetical protein
MKDIIIRKPSQRDVLVPDKTKDTSEVEIIKIPSFLCFLFFIKMSKPKAKKITEA